MDQIRDLYRHVTDQIVAAIEAGADDYRMPWHVVSDEYGNLRLPGNPIGKYRYRGINVLALWMSQRASDYPSSEWASFRQWQKVGAQVRRGEKGTLTVFFKPVERSGADEDDRADGANLRKRLIAKAAYVFNAAQVDGYQSEQPCSISAPGLTKCDRAERLLTNSRAMIIYGGGRACYVPSRDEIHLPHLEAFIDPASYYGVAFHEMTHWTGHESRCARDLRNRFGSEAYSAEELVAELGAAFISAAIGIAPEPRTDHASYIARWLKILRDDKRAIFTAAGKASQATDFILNLADEEPQNEAA